jgi:Flp pilus assembly protein TadD
MMIRWLVIVMVMAGFARAETPPPAQLAADENEQGKELMIAGNYKDAGARFRSALEHDPQARYYFNLCSALYQQGIFGQALKACQAALPLGPDAALRTKTERMIERIRSDAKAQQIPVDPVRESDPAARANQDGVDQMRAGKAAGAAVKFFEAVVRDPRADYLFNLCTAHYQAGHFSEALAACTEVARHEPSADLAAKVAKLTQHIRDDAKAQHVTLVTLGPPGSPADRAEVSNQDGVDLMYAHEDEQARTKFRDAVARDRMRVTGEGDRVPAVISPQQARLLHLVTQEVEGVRHTQG